MSKINAFALIACLSSASVAVADEVPLEPSASGATLLDTSATLPSFGSIRFKTPSPDAEGLPIVLFHGVYGGASHRAFRELLPELHAANKKVYLMDLAGVGESDKPKRPYAITDLDQFIVEFLEVVVQQRATVVAESLTTVAALKVSADRPDLIRRLVLLSPTGVKSLNQPPSEREQRLYDRLYNGTEEASDAFYQNLLEDNSLRYFLGFAFSDDRNVDEDLLNDYRAMRPITQQKWLTLSFVGGQLYRPFADAVRGVFVPTLVLLGADYEAFADNEPTRLADFAAIRPDFEYIEIAGSGSSVQREKPAEVAREIVIFATED